MSTSAQFDLQTALYTLLHGDGALAILAPGGVHDHVDQDGLPLDTNGKKAAYIVIGEQTEIPDDSHDHAGRELTATIHAWSEYEGNKEAAGIISRITSILDRTTALAMGDDWQQVDCVFEFSTILREDTGRHGVARYRIILYEAD